MRRSIAALALIAGSLAAFAPQAHAAGARVCYSVSVTVNGEAVVDEAACHEVAP